HHDLVDGDPHVRLAVVKQSIPCRVDPRTQLAQTDGFGSDKHAEELRALMPALPHRGADERAIDSSDDCPLPHAAAGRLGVDRHVVRLRTDADTPPGFDVNYPARR